MGDAGLALSFFYDLSHPLRPGTVWPWFQQISKGRWPGKGGHAVLQPPPPQGLKYSDAPMNSNEHWKLRPGNSVLKRLESIWQEGEELQSRGGLWHVPSCVLCSDPHLFPGTGWEGTGWHGPKLCQDTCTEVASTLIYTLWKYTGGVYEPCWPTTPAPENSCGREGSLGSISDAHHAEPGTSISLGYQQLLCAHRAETVTGTRVPGWPWAGIAARGQSPASTAAHCWAPLVDPGHMEQQH